MKKIHVSVFLFLLFAGQSFATHQRAAEIIYTHVEGLTYNIKIITYTNDNDANNMRDYLPIEWGDEKSEQIPRLVKTLMAANFVYNEYEGVHTYPAIGSYMISMEDPTRNYGVANIPNSVYVPIYVQSQLIINPLVGGNNSVRLLNKPIDYGCVEKIYYHNPGAYDPDGDSLSFRLVKCRGEDGEFIPGFVMPNMVLPDAANTFTIDPATGTLTWDTPNLQGDYNIAILIEEWRLGIKVGSVLRDMQIQITSCDENPPLIKALDDTCIIAGENLIFNIKAFSQDTNVVSIYASGGPFEISDYQAYIEPDPATGKPMAETVFNWETSCQQVQKYPYQVFVKAIDDGTPVNLVAFKTIGITVTAPPVLAIEALPFGNSINIEWEKTECEKAKSYKIYRHTGPYNFEPGYCETGVPGYTGFVFLDEITDINILNYSDEYELVHGVTYCYIVTVGFWDGAESYASNEVCASLERDLPVITNVSNDSENDLNGNLYLAWSKPIDLDTVLYPGPYQYFVFRGENLSGGSLDRIKVLDGLDDTLLTDLEVNINTSGIPYHYEIGLSSLTVGDIGNSTSASSVFLSLYETDRKMVLSWDFFTPWLNTDYEIYRKDPGASTYQWIGFTNNKKYTDTGLENGLEYCYYVKSIGTFSTSGLIDPIINYSQKACGIPYDNVPPCPPMLSVWPDCETISNFLRWTNPREDSCDTDIDKYLIYFGAKEGSFFTLFDSTLNINDTTYLHSGLQSIIGCYQVRAVDFHGNISMPSNTACSDTSCGGYKLPNAFTPNGDGFNDNFQAYPNSIGAVNNIDLVIMNRLGKIVYKSTDKFFEWDGRDNDSGSALPESVYYYVCDVFEYAGGELQKRTLKGSITLLK
jgi:gliding motility-associated-like protein